MFRLTLLILAGSLPGFAAELTDSPPVAPPTSSRCAPAIACAAPLPASEGVTVLAGSDGRDGDGQLVHAGEMSITYDLAQNVQFNFVSNTLVLPEATPLQANGVQAGLKLSLIEESSWWPSNALSLHLTVPTWAGGQKWGFEGWWYFSKTFAAVKAALNVMVAVSDLMGRPAPQGLTTMTISTGLRHGVGLFGEAWATWGQTQARPPGAGLFAGVSLALGDAFVLDVGGEVAVHPNGPVLTVFGGLTWSPRWRPPASERPEVPSTHVVAADLTPGFELISLTPDPADLPLKTESLFRTASWSR
ncbi:MAG: hypothetical protein Q8N23_05815 [Archangium sp.]|nr:hypothetical protein [Archangium sp.]MDP3152166.1 hypothetical protein [Archangium sp.]MDP3574952.1 hypothetical protein [Archangium sp.]